MAVIRRGGGFVPPPSLFEGFLSGCGGCVGWLGCCRWPLRGGIKQWLLDGLGCLSPGAGGVRLMVDMASGESGTNDKNGRRGNRSAYLGQRIHGGLGEALLGRHPAQAEPERRAAPLIAIPSCSSKSHGPLWTKAPARGPTAFALCTIPVGKPIPVMPDLNAGRGVSAMWESVPAKINKMPLSIH